ncbi:hypothetical protein HDV03_003901 [Kappamyces sp. JEL0829]|nr:hypothetical protein HDV03_003901 [Kappamyces sp. JEL0829]
MPKFLLQWKLEVQNVTDIQPSSEDFDWTFKLQCTKCHENDGPVTFKSTDVVEQSNSRGHANLVMTCKFCKSQGTLDVLWKTMQPYSDEKSGQMQPLVVIEGRGWEPLEFQPADGIFKCRGSDSGTEFADVNLSEDWAEYDEKAGGSVEIMEFGHQFIKTK